MHPSCQIKQWKLNSNIKAAHIVCISCKLKAPNHCSSSVTVCISVLETGCTHVIAEREQMAVWYPKACLGAEGLPKEQVPAQETRRPRFKSYPGEYRLSDYPGEHSCGQATNAPGEHPTRVPILPRRASSGEHLTQESILPRRASYPGEHPTQENYPGEHPGILPRGWDTVRAYPGEHPTQESILPRRAYPGEHPTQESISWP